MGDEESRVGNLHTFVFNINLLINFFLLFQIMFVEKRYLVEFSNGFT